MHNQQRDYIKDGLILHLDGIDNTRHGFDENTSVWEDLSPMQNDANLYNIHTSYGYYSVEEKGYVFLHNNAYAKTINNIGLSGFADHTVEIVAKPYSVADGSTVFNGYLWFGDRFASEGMTRIFGYNRGTAGRHGVVVAYLNTMVTYDLYPEIEMTHSVSFRTNKHGTIQAGMKDPYILSYNGEYREGVATGKTYSDRLLNSPVEIGRYWQYNNENRTFYGSIQSVRIYDRVLTDEEVLHNYRVDKRRFGIT